MNNQEESRIVYVRFEEWLESLQTIAYLPPTSVEQLRSQWNVHSPWVCGKFEVAGEAGDEGFVLAGSLAIFVVRSPNGILSLYTRPHAGHDNEGVLTVPSVPSPHTQENEVRTCEDLHSTPAAQCQTDTAHAPDVASIQRTLQELESKLEDLDAVFELLDLQAQRDRTYLEHRLDYLETTVARVLYPSCDKPRKKSKKARASSKSSGRRPVRKGRRAKA